MGEWSDSKRKFNAHIYVYDTKWKQKGLILLQGENQVFDIFPIEKILDPAKFFEDNRFQKEPLVGISTTSEITENEEVLLNLYSASCVRSGRLNEKINTIRSSLKKQQQQQHHTRLEKLERRTISGRWKKLKRSIKKRFQILSNTSTVSKK